jgi:hypothetical protein
MSGIALPAGSGDVGLCYADRGERLLMLQITFTLSAALVFFCTNLIAQDPVNFSGVWQMDASRSESAHQGTPIGPVTITIKQATNEVSIETRRENENHTTANETLSFKLDGSERPVGGTQDVQKVKAHWDGSKLVTETERKINGATVTTMDIFSLDTSGKEMTIEKTLTVQHGYESKAGNNIGKAKDVFIKKTGR